MIEWVANSWAGVDQINTLDHEHLHMGHRSVVRGTVSQVALMAAFDPGAELSGPPDYRLVANTFVTMFWNPSVLEEALKWLSANGYQIVDVPAGSWREPSDMHRDLAAALDFPGYYGNNLHALNDCLGDVASGDYGLDRVATGLVLVLTAFDRFAAAEPVGAHALLDIFAVRARNAALFGQRMICIVQSDDPDLRFPPVGATDVGWNDAEWPNSARKPADP